ncbi:MAG: hypothetical protein ACP5IG_01055 [Candidatus Micrarchaeia archaeon]
MRAAALFSFLLAVFTAQAAAFHEFAQLIPQGSEYAAFNAFSQASSCVGMNGEFLLASSDLETEKLFADSLQLAAQCKNNMKSAQWIAHYQSHTLFGWGSMLMGAFFCFYDAATGLNYCSSAARSGLNVVDEALAQLEYAAGENYSGMAGGVIAEAREAEKKLNEKNFSGRFAESFNKASTAASAAWQSLATRPSAPAFTFAAASLVSTSSLLSEEMILARKIVEAEYELERERATAEEEAERLQAITETRLSEAVEQKLYLASEASAALAMGGGALLLEGGNTETFGEAVARAKWEEEEGSALLSLARKTGTAKNKGFLGDAIKALRQSQERFSSAASLLEETMKRAEKLEQKLDAAVAERYAEVSSVVSKRLTSAPESAGRASSLLEQVRKELEKQPSARGERIAFLCRHLTLLNGVLAVAAAPQQEPLLRNKVNTKINWAQQILEKAEKDGVVVDFQKAQLKSVEAAAEGISSDEKGVAALVELEREVDAIVKSVYGAALEKYSWLEGDWKFLEEAREALQVSEQEKLSSKAQYFWGGLNVEAALGELQETAKVVEREKALAESRLPQLVARLLAQNAVVTQEKRENWVDNATEVDVKIVLRNPLSVAVNEAVEVELDELKPLAGAAYVIIVNASEGVSLNDEKIVLESVRAGGEYFLHLRYASVAAKTISFTESTEWASLSEARKKITWGFTCAAAGEVVLARRVAGRVSGAWASFGATAFFDSQSKTSTVGARAYCLPGANKIEISYSIAEPFAVTRQEHSEADAVAIEYSFKSSAELAGARLALREQFSGCAGPVRVESELRETHFLAEGILAVELVGSWKEGEEKKAVVSIACPAHVQPLPYFNASQETESASYTQYRQETQETRATQGANSTEPYSMLALNTKDTGDALKEDTGEALKNQAAQDLEKAVGAARETAKVFDSAFLAPEGMKHSKSLAEQRGATARKNAEKTWVEAEKVIASPPKYSVEYAKQKARDLEEARALMEEAITEVREQAKAELAVAEARQKEFGNAASQALLEEAQDAFTQQEFLAALLKASKLNSQLAGVPSPATAEAEASGFASWALGVAGLAIIGLLYLFLSRKKERELKEF